MAKLAYMYVSTQCIKPNRHAHCILHVHVSLNLSWWTVLWLLNEVHVLRTKIIRILIIHVAIWLVLCMCIFGKYSNPTLQDHWETWGGAEFQVGRYDTTSKLELLQGMGRGTNQKLFMGLGIDMFWSNTFYSVLERPLYICSIKDACLLL